MGFLKFLKRRREEDLLDVPPLPPLTEQDMEFPSLESEAGGLGLGEIPSEEIPPPPIEALEPIEPLPETEDINLISSMPQQEGSRFIKMPITAKKQISEQLLEKEVPREAQTQKNYFISILQYNRIADELSISRADVKSAEERILAVSQYNEVEERHMAKLKSEFDDIQKKLVIIDRILAK